MAVYDYYEQQVNQRHQLNGGFRDQIDLLKQRAASDLMRDHELVNDVVNARVKNLNDSFRFINGDESRMIRHHDDLNDMREGIYEVMTVMDDIIKDTKSRGGVFHFDPRIEEELKQVAPNLPSAIDSDVYARITDHFDHSQVVMAEKYTAGPIEPSGRAKAEFLELGRKLGLTPDACTYDQIMETAAERLTVFPESTMVREVLNRATRTELHDVNTRMYDVLNPESTITVTSEPYAAIQSRYARDEKLINRVNDSVPMIGALPVFNVDAIHQMITAQQLSPDFNPADNIKVQRGDMQRLAELRKQEDVTLSRALGRRVLTRDHAVNRVEGATDQHMEQITSIRDQVLDTVHQRMEDRKAAHATTTTQQRVRAASNVHPSRADDQPEF